MINMEVLEQINTLKQKLDSLKQKREEMQRTKEEFTKLYDGCSYETISKVDDTVKNIFEGLEDINKGIHLFFGDNTDFEKEL